MCLSILTARKIVASLALALPLLAVLPTDAIARKFSAEVVSFSRHITPAPLRPSGGDGGLTASSRRMGQLITHIARSELNAGPRPSDLVSNAFELREDIAPVLGRACSSNILEQFRRAELLGAIDDNGNFTGRITKGRDAGTEVEYGYIVPPDMVPEFGASLANVQLFAPSDARPEDPSADSRTLAVADQFRMIIRNTAQVAEQREAEEARRDGTSNLDRTPKEHDQVWAELTRANPEFLEARPAIRSTARTTKSRVGPGAQEVTAAVQNLSRHPTEVTYELLLVARHQRGDSVVIGRNEGALKLLSGEMRRLVVTGRTTPATKTATATHLRGWVLRIRHNGDIVDQRATNGGLLEDFQ